MPIRVVLADELPYSSPHSVASPADDASERSHTGARHRHRSARAYHPGPGVFVAVVDARGGVPAADLERAVRDLGYWPLRRCYEEGLRRDQSLRGRVSLDVAVLPAGEIGRAQVASSSLRDESVGLCIAREVSRVRGPGAAAPTEARVEVSLSTGDEPVPVPRPVPHAEALREALRASWPAVEQCYATELARRPDSGGRLELRFRAMSTGEVLDVSERGDMPFADADTMRCVLGVYRATRLPAARVCSSRPTSFYYAMHLEAKP